MVSSRSNYIYIWRNKLISVCHLVFISLVILVLNNNSYADEIYKWTDQNGRVHFSDKPFVKGQKKAKLPRVEKVNIEQRIKKLKKYSDKSCVNHGGIDCSQGVDEADGSVICLDGYNKTLIKFQERCTNAKLTVKTELVEKSGTTKIDVILRNESAIKAKNIRVKYKLEEFREIEFDLEGAKEIEPYGLENYSFFSRKKLDIKYPTRKIKGKAIVKCDNCSNIRRLR